MSVHIDENICTCVSVATQKFLLVFKNHNYISFDVLLTVLLSTFISVFNQLDAQNLFHNTFYFMSLHVSSDRLCGLMVRVSGYKYRGLGFDSRRYQIF